MNETFKAIINLKNSEIFKECSSKSPTERNGFDKFWVALYIVY